ncbi:TonB-dependent receptor [Acuticoccus sediminis]|uniref:TonB-dependent receptor n=1 Tax=Acuticoccus sediminis TaxID=2184697 RepID=A0A8B2NT15_9HYPH|nr:TonB-dependent receptor [Acuticoccus sediminis]RAI00304.1 TonB-dependent receptor [Acuticoccus sediminis]
MRQPVFGCSSRFALPLACAAALAAIPAHAPAYAQDGTSGVISLEEIVVTSNLTPTAERAVGSAVTIIDETELEDRKVRVVADVLRTVPGVTVNRTGVVGNQTQLRIRGAESNQTLVMIDGIEVNDPSGGSEFDFAHLLTQGVARIEVLRGPQSALYGSDAIGGVVNIVTRRADGTPTASGFFEGGTRATASGGLSAGGSVGKFDYFASFGGLRTEGFSSAAEWKGNHEKDGYENVTAFGKIGFQPIEALRFDAVGRLTSYSAESDDFIGGIGPVDGDGSSEGLQLFGRAQARLDLWDGRWRHTAGVARSRFDNDYLDGGIVTSSYLGTRTKFDYQSDLSLETPAASATHDLTFRLEHQIDAAEVDGYSTFDRSVGETSVVGQYRLGVWDRLFLTGSLRHDVNELFDDATTYRLTAAYNIDETGTKLRASYGTGVKNPTLFELYGYTDTYHGNPDLKPEEAAGWDVGIDQWLWRERLMVQATYFNQRITDLIQGSGETSVNVAGTSEIHGVELAVAATPVEGLTLRGSYTYTDGEDARGVRLTRRPMHQASLDANYRFWQERANVNIELLYTGEQTDLFYNADYSTRVVDLDPYVVVNAAASWDINENAQVYGRVENLFNTRYEQAYGYGSPGFSAVAGLRLSF